MSLYKKSHDSGELKYHLGLLSYRCGANQWTVAISEIRLIGEHTTDEGPFVDDYFLTFFVSEKLDGWFRASFYANGRDEALAEIGEQLKAPLILGLCNSAEFKSRVLWPVGLANNVLFEFTPPKSAFDGFRQKWLGASVELVLSPAAKEAFEK